MTESTHTILISGWGTSRGRMEVLADRLGLQDFTALSLKDLYERGNSVAARDGEISVYSAGLGNILTQAGSSANILGWSTGGVVALESAGRTPERVRRLILLSTTPKFCADESFPHGTPLPNLRAMQKGIRRAPEQTMMQFLVQAGTPLRMDDGQIEETVADAMAQGRDVLAHGLQYLETSDFRQAVPGIDCPALIIHGQRDRIIPWRAAEWLHQNLPHSELLLYPRGGHLLTAQHGNEIVPKIEKFLR